MLAVNSIRLRLRMKIVVLVLSFLLIQTAVSQVTRQECLDSGIKDSSLPETIPVENPATDGPCTNNFCCTSDYIAVLRENIQVNVFKECVKDSFDDLIDTSEDFFDNFADSFGDFARNSIFSSFSVRAGVGEDTSMVYIDNELTYSSQLLANLTFERIRGDEDDRPRFLNAIREYACDYLASLIQKTSYPNSLRVGRLTGSCICQLRTADGTVESVIDGIIGDTIERFSSTIDNIANLVRAISGIRDISLRNLRVARDFNISSICTRQFINSIACQHCQGRDVRACPDSCRIVSFLCLQPLRQAFTDSYGTFIMYVRLALESIIGDNLDSDGRFDFHDLQEITGVLNRRLSELETRVTVILKEALSSGQTIRNSTCFITRTQDIEDGTFKCQDDSDRDDSIPDCTRKEGDREIVDVDDRPDGGTTERPSDRTERPSDTDSDGDDRREGDEFERTIDEDDFVAFVKRLLARFDVYGNFDSIFTRINKCVCRASESAPGDATPTPRSDDSDDEDRLMTLFVATDANCFRRFSSDFTTNNIDDNPAYRSLTEDEMRQVKEFDVEVSARFSQLGQFVDDDESISSTFEQLTGGTSDAGRLLTSILLVLASAFLTILFVMV